jgi:hypothetical protein
VISPTIDRLRVFVSSTINECSPERAVVRKAIRSINHEPVLFEDIGARPHPPRELYKARLEESQIFVGIYREAYGWVAPNMDISGVEDEFRIASDRKMDRLIYVFGSPIARDPKLEALIETAKNSGLTVASYSDPMQLRERIRQDVTAVVSSRFVDQAVASDDAPKPDELLDSLLPNHAHRFRRWDVESKLLTAVAENSRIVVTAPLGSGKTIMLAQLAADNNWIFVDGQGLSRLDLFARVANSIRQRAGQNAITFTTEKSATQEILAGCGALTDVVLAVDNAEDPRALWNMPARSYRLVLTSRAPLEIPTKQHFDVPPLTREEVSAWVTALRGIHPDASELSNLFARSGGNPLYLRFYALGGTPSADLSLRELEVRAVESLSPRAREITSYLALSSRPLSLEDLRLLIDSEQSPEFVAQQIAEASGLVRQTHRHVQLVHEHLRATLVDQLRDAPARLHFFANRLGRYFEHTGRFVAAFYAYLEADEQHYADRVIDQAAYQAALMGGGAPAIAIYKRQAELARELRQFAEVVHALLALAYAFNQTGARADAIQAVDAARIAAKQQADETEILRVTEVATLLELAGSSRDERIREIGALRKSYAEARNAFDAARMGTLLAAEYIAKRDFANAEMISRDVLEFFNGAGDEYGIRVTQVNLASALSGMNGREQEAGAILQQLQRDLDPEDYPRERAALCNFLTRHYRRLQEPARAAEFAIEAIRIGEQLGDCHLIAMNRVNLGNVRRDQSALDQALDEYRSAERAALTGCITEDEATANELIASVFNERKEYALASQHAQHAAALAHRVGDPVLIARAEEEHAIALKGQREFDAAVAAYANAAKTIAEFRPEATYFVSLVTDALILCAKSRRVDLKILLLTSIFAPELKAVDGDDDIHPIRALYAVLPSIAKSIRVDRLLPIVALAFGDVLTDAPPVIERRIILQAAKELVDSKTEIKPSSVLMVVAGILMAHSGNCLTLGDLVTLSERLTRFSPHVYFKPQSDGAAHWTIRLEIATGIVVTVAQLDDSPQTAVTTMVVALLLKSLEGLIRRSLLDADRIPRQEAVINVVRRAELEAQLGPTLAGLGTMPNRFSIGESTDLARSDQPPIVLICADEFGKPWRPEEHAFSDAIMLLAELLRALAGHLLGKAIEPEVLFPKISGMIRKIGCHGSSDDEAAQI